MISHHKVTNVHLMAGQAALRNRDATKDALIQAVGTLITSQGFDALGVNAVAREAGVDKVLIYRYFDGLSGLLAAYGNQGDYWWQVDDLIGDHLPGPSEDSLSAWLSLVFQRHVDYLRHHLVTQVVLAWAMSERNPLTEALEETRERRGRELMHRILAKTGTDDRDTMRYIGPVMTLLQAASDHLVAHGRLQRTYGGVDVASDFGWSQIYETVEVMLAGLLNEGG